MKGKTTHAIGIDASLAHTAIVSIDLAKAMTGPRWLNQPGALQYIVINTSSDANLGARLSHLLESARGFFHDKLCPDDLVAIEGFSFGDRFNQYDLGAAQGVIRVAAHTALPKRPVDIASVPPRQAKKFICPRWHGWSKNHWQLAGREGKFKASMPKKPDVAQALFEHFRYDPGNEHVVDACLVALAHAREAGIVRREHLPLTLRNAEPQN